MEMGGSDGGMAERREMRLREENWGKLFRIKFYIDDGTNDLMDLA